MKEQKKNTIYKVLTKDGIVSSNIKGLYAGWKIGKIYGKLDCKSGTKMKKENRVFFLNEKDAIECEYRKCKKCMK